MLDHAAVGGVLLRRRGVLACLCLCAGMTACSQTSAQVAAESGWVRECPGEVFCFSRPAELKSQPVQAIDSLVGRYQGQGMALSFDVGRYVSPMAAAPDSIRTQTLDGRPAQLLLGAKQARLYIARIHPAEATTVGMGMFLKADGDLPEGLALKIFQSIIFKPPR